MSLNSDNPANRPTQLKKLMLRFSENMCEIESRAIYTIPPPIENDIAIAAMNRSMKNRIKIKLYKFNPF